MEQLRRLWRRRKPGNRARKVETIKRPRSRAIISCREIDRSMEFVPPGNYGVRADERRDRKRLRRRRETIALTPYPAANPIHRTISNKTSTLQSVHFLCQLQKTPAQRAPGTTGSASQLRMKQIPISQNSWLAEQLGRAHGPAPFNQAVTMEAQAFSDAF